MSKMFNPTRKHLLLQCWKSLNTSSFSYLPCQAPPSFYLQATFRNHLVPAFHASLRVSWQGLVSPPHVLISADQNYAYTFSSHFGWKATRQWPTQHHSVLISTDQSAQCWSVHSMLDHWMLIRTEWHWTELDFTCCYYINNKKKCRSKDWTIAFTYITWPTLTILPLSHTVFIRHRTIILYMSFSCAPSQMSLGKHWHLIWCQTTLNPFLFLHHHHPPWRPHSAASPPHLPPPLLTTITNHPQPTPHPCQWRWQHLAMPRHLP